MVSSCDFVRIKVTDCVFRIEVSSGYKFAVQVFHHFFCHTLWFFVMSVCIVMVWSGIIMRVKLSGCIEMLPIVISCVLNSLILLCAGKISLSDFTLLVTCKVVCILV